MTMPRQREGSKHASVVGKAVERYMLIGPTRKNPVPTHWIYNSRMGLNSGIRALLSGALNGLLEICFLHPGIPGT